MTMRYDDECRNCEHLERQLDRAEDRAEQAERDLQGANLELRLSPDVDAVDRLEAEREALRHALRAAADELHEYGHVGTGAEDFTDCPEEGCLERSRVLGYVTIAAEAKR